MARLRLKKSAHAETFLSLLATTKAERMNKAKNGPAHDTLSLKPPCYLYSTSGGG